MKISALVFAAILFVTPIPAFADKLDVAAEVVSCVNATNEKYEAGQKTPLFLLHMILERPFEHSRVHLAEGFFLIRGINLGHVGGWVALLDGSPNDWAAYEILNRDGKPRLFSVPLQVIAALDLCGVQWGGTWDEKLPFVERVPPARVPLLKALRLPDDPFKNGANLLPPVSKVD